MADQAALAVAGIELGTTDPLKIALLKSRDEYEEVGSTVNRYLQQTVACAMPATLLADCEIVAGSVAPLVLNSSTPIPVGDSTRLAVQLRSFSTDVVSWPADLTSVTIVPYACDVANAEVVRAIFPAITLSAAGWVDLFESGSYQPPVVVFDTYGFDYIAFMVTEFTAVSTCGLGVTVYSC